MIHRIGDLVKLSPLYFEYKDGSSNKFWEISPDGWHHGDVASFWISWGRIGSQGQVQKYFGNHLLMASKIRSKVNKGYMLRSRPTSRSSFQVGMAEGKMGLVIDVVNAGHSILNITHTIDKMSNDYNATVMINGDLTTINTQFLTTVKSKEYCA